METIFLVRRNKQLVTDTYPLIANAVDEVKTSFVNCKIKLNKIYDCSFDVQEAVLQCPDSKAMDEGAIQAEVDGEDVGMDHFRFGAEPDQERIPI